MDFLRVLLFPFSLVYWLVVVIRNLLYDLGWLKSRKFGLPVIVVGNLEAGGAGKTPVTELLIRLLKDRYKLATLSRGYGRNTRGFICLEPGQRAGGAAVTAVSIGDEPFQYFSKFQDITVAVGEDRVKAVEQLKAGHRVILLDDALQHRRLRPGFSIAVLDYDTLFRPRMLLPAGNYREPFRGRKRADILLVTKAPGTLGPEEKERIVKRLKPSPGQPVYFSSLVYESLQPLYPARPVPELDGKTHILLVTGIARPEPFVKYIRSLTPHVRHLKYPDHHSFTVKNIAKIAELFERIESGNKLILTTEKDAARFRAPAVKEAMQGLPVCYWPVRVHVHEPGKTRFEKSILNYVATYAGTGQAHR